MQIIDGKIVGADESGILIRAPFADWERFVKRRYEDVQIGLEDGRTITPEQRCKAYALMNEITEWSGNELEEVKAVMKHDFIREHLQGLKKELFSLSNCDVTTAREYISYLIDFIIRMDVPTKVPLVTLCDDVERYLYACIMHRHCAVCGRPSDLHHSGEKVGMGRNRKEIIHEGLELEALCRIHHTECHTMPQSEFDEKYHVHGIKATKEICKKWGLKYNAE